MFQMKEQGKTSEENQVDIGNLPEKEFRVMIIRLTKELRQRVDPQRKI